MLSLLILIGIYGIYKIVKEILGDNKHLLESEIREYKSKRRTLSETKQRRVTNHVGICDECRERFSEIMKE